MNLVPRIRLRTIFVLFFCTAVGLAAYPHPLSALEPAIVTAMVIGLSQQSWQLWRLRLGASDSGLGFAREFSIVWRVGLAFVMAACVIATVVYRNGLLQLTDEEKVSLSFDLLNPFTSISIAFVLCNSILRLRSGLDYREKQPQWSWLIWLFAAVLAMLVVVHGSLIAYLVHQAVEGIEASIPAQFQRPGVYPNLRQESFRPFWIAAGAVLSFFLAAAMLVCCVWQTRSTWQRFAALVAGVALLAIPLSFCQWFYVTEFHRLSPELAGAGLDASAIDWLVGGTVGCALITTCAYQLAKSKQVAGAVSTDLSIETDSTSLHESVPVLLLVAVHGIYVLAALVMQVANVGSIFGRQRIMFYVSTLWDPTSLLVLAQAVAALQLCWIRYQRRSQTTSWKLYGLSPRVFFESWALIAILLLIGIPTLNAFAFIAWLGPFNLRALHGF